MYDRITARIEKIAFAITNELKLDNPYYHKSRPIAFRDKNNNLWDITTTLIENHKVIRRSGR